MKRLKTFGPSLTVIAAILLLYSWLPLGTALEFGEDEGFELMKGFLCSQGFPLYTAIGNDQPPLFPKLLSAVFCKWGPTILVARLVAAGFGLVLFGAFYNAVSRRSGQWPAILATFFLAAAPTVLLLSVSVMKEVSAIGIALVSVCLLLPRRVGPRWLWLVASGLTMGVALQIKLSASLLVPAMLVEIALGGRLPQERPEALGEHPASPRRPVRTQAQADRTRQGASGIVGQQSIAGLSTWLAGTAASFALIAILWGRGSFVPAWKANFAAHAVAGFGSPEDFHFPANVFLNHVECVIAAALGIWVLARQRRWPELRLPLVLLCTGLAVHAWHRPWWMYHYLHLAVPLAWLGGIAAGELILTASQLLRLARSRPSSFRVWKGVALCALTALAIARSEARLEGSLKDVRQRLRASASPVLAKMKAYAGQTHWVYADKQIYAFHAQLPMPPPVAVVSLKRYLVGPDLQPRDCGYLPALSCRTGLAGSPPHPGGVEGSLERALQNRLRGQRLHTLRGQGTRGEIFHAPEMNLEGEGSSRRFIPPNGG